MFIFPRDIPYHLYIQALPSMRDFIDFANDILSFYKEECSGDTNNFISLLAQGPWFAKDQSPTLRGAAVLNGL